MLILSRVHASPPFQSRVAAPVLSDPRPPPPAPVFSPFRDGHYWCSKCPRRGFTTIPGLMRHVTAPARGLCSGRAPLAPCSRRSKRVTCTAPACGGLRRMGARICNRCGRRPVRPGPPEWATSSWALLVLPPVARMWPWLTLEPPPRPALTVDLPLVDLPDWLHATHPCASPRATILPVPAPAAVCA